MNLSATPFLRAMFAVALAGRRCDIGPQVGHPGGLKLSLGAFTLSTHGAASYPM